MSNTSIDAKYLIDPRFTSITKQIVKKDQVIDVYLHNLSGPTVVSGGLFGSQIIDALAWNDSDINFAHSFIDDLDSRLGIDFAVTTEKTRIRYQYLSRQDIDIGSDGKTLGLAITNFSEDSGYFWEIFLDRDAFLMKDIFVMELSTKSRIPLEWSIPSLMMTGIYLALAMTLGKAHIQKTQ